MDRLTVARLLLAGLALLLASGGVVEGQLSPPPAVPATCSDNCGAFNQEANCYCDNYCTFVNDCCNDYVAVCVNGDDGGASCNGFCGTGPSSGNCYCDSLCKGNGDCCEDFEDQCNAIYNGDDFEGSCTDDDSNPLCGGAGTGNCYCDEYCTYNGDCCSDYNTACVENPNSPTTPGTTCEGICGSYSEEGNCGCDLACFTLEDCCDDREEICGPRPVAVGNGTCDGQCGGIGYGIPEGATACYCDDICQNVVPSDCCLDYATSCSNTPPPPGSCKDNCGSYSSSGDEISCYCDDLCSLNNDCCGDYESECVATTSGSCKGNCGGNGGADADGVDCWCDSFCCFNGDCCDDKEAECTETVEDGSCVDHCGSCADLCCCDGICNSFGDCCEDKADVCSDVPPSPPTPPPPTDIANFVKLGDSMEKPIIIPVDLPFTDHGSTEGFSDVAVPGTNCGDTTNSSDVFYEYTFDLKSGAQKRVIANLCGDETKFDTALYVLKKTEGEELVNQECNSGDSDRNGCGIEQSSLAVTLEADEVYFFVVDGVNNSFGEYRLTIEELKGDSLADPFIIPSLPFSIDGSTKDYSNSLESKVCGSTVGSTSPDVVYQYYATESGTLSISSCQADFNSSLYVLKVGVEGSSIPVPVACSVDDENSRQDCGKGVTLSIDVEEFHTYAIVIDGFEIDEEKQAGKYRLVVTDVVGDSVANPITIMDAPKLSYNNDYILEGFTSSFEPKANCINGVAPEDNVPDVIFQYLALESATVSVSLCGSSYDTVLTILKANGTNPDDQSAESTTPVGCNDDANRDGCSTASEFAFKAEQDSIYFFVVDGLYQSAVGSTFRISVTKVGCDTPDKPCSIQFSADETLLSVDGSTVGHLHSSVSEQCAPLDESSCSLSDTMPDVVYSLTPSFGGMYTISTCGSESNTAVVVHEETFDEAPVTCKCSDHPSEVRGDCDAKAAEVQVPLIAGVPYYIGVISLDTPGPYRLTINNSMPFSNSCSYMEVDGSTNTFCGLGNLGASGQCHCDALCNLQNDCCDDFSTICNDALTSKQCDESTCGTILISDKDGSSCSCDPDKCQAFNNCCTNVNDVCKGFVEPPGGDTLLDAITISKIPYADQGTTEGFSNKVSLPDLCNIQGSSSEGAPEVFYKYQTGKKEIPVVISLCNNLDFDTVLYLYKSEDCDIENSTCDSSAAVECNDDSKDDEGCGSGSVIRTDLQPNTLYYIIVDGFSKNEAGFYEFEIEDLSKEVGSSAGASKSNGAKIALVFLLVLIFVAVTALVIGAFALRHFQRDRWRMILEAVGIRSRGDRYIDSGKMIDSTEEPPFE